jgi:hypothetical protein
MGSITATLAKVSRALGGSGIMPQTSQLNSAAGVFRVEGFIPQASDGAVSVMLPRRSIHGNAMAG